MYNFRMKTALLLFFAALSLYGQGSGVQPGPTGATGPTGPAGATGATGATGVGSGIDRVWMCSMNSSAVPGCSLSVGTTNYPTPNSVLGSNVQGGAVLTFPSGSQTYSYGQMPITGTVPASLTMEINWRTTDTNTGHTVIWNWYYGCSSTSIDPSLASAGAVTANAVSSSNQTTLSTITLSSPSCTAGQFLFFYLSRRGDTDTVTAGVDVNSLRIHS